ncbi:type II secretion system F family protein [Arthrobacter sp. MI7-26]|uniref:type II secretion system F family protein n=1 Tax=Arthrobacter sp. MI7-26 TaxID=2993653 RepID=UPI0022493C95|nr:type II secretion system F family protein [Arthrobacter sp. MI7-26]MCX2747176.1 type II secretion system F family protein [Arthrobacter sp. MI7-26]
MDSTFPAIAVSVVLISAVVLGLANPGRSRQRTVLRMLRGSPGGIEPPKHLHGGQSSGVARNSQRRRSDGHEGLRNVPMILELVAAMLDSGAGLGRTLELIAGCASPQLSRSLGSVVAALDIGTDWETAWRSSGQQCAEARRLKDALAFAALTGAPSSAILYAQAARLRREQFRAAEKRAAALGVKLVIPLGLCSLPAFICLGIVPVLLAMLPSAG